MGDRILNVCFAASFSIHLVVAASQWAGLPWARGRPPRRHAPIEVIYAAQTDHKQQQQLEAQVMRARRDTAMAPLTASLGEQMQIRIPDRPLLGADATLLTQAGGVGGAGGANAAAFGTERAPVVDLANLLETAGSNPVMLSYFSVIRDQIQNTANRRPWAAGAAAEGVIYVRFVLVSNGTIHGAGVVPDKSAGSSALRGVAMQIVQTAAPFPPFPPSLQDPSKDVVVPLEFLLGP